MRRSAAERRPLPAARGTAPPHAEKHGESDPHLNLRLTSTELTAFPPASRRGAHPLHPRWENVLDHDGSAALVTGEALPAARHRHGAVGLVPRVLPVDGVAHRTCGPAFERRLDAIRAKRVRTLQGLPPPDPVQTDGAIVRTLTPPHGLTIRVVFHRLKRGGKIYYFRVSGKRQKVRVAQKES